ncbi:ATP-binding cassette domain-containing protein, partial [Acinetobacter baumannii]
LMTAESLSKFYGARTGCRDVSFDLHAGEVLAVVGESGSGKSTLASVIMRLLPPNLSRLSGEVRLDGTDLLRLDPAGMARVRGN